MNKLKSFFSWEKQKKSKDYEFIDCSEYDTHKDFHRDPSGYYLLIKVNFEIYRIDVALCAKNHEIEKVFSGRKAQDLYHTILKYEKENSLKWFQEKSHIAYLGKELKKAEIALAMGNNAYCQE